MSAWCAVRREVGKALPIIQTPTKADMVELARYVALNPVRAGKCELPEDWPWSSYHVMLRRATPPQWLQFGCSCA